MRTLYFEINGQTLRKIDNFSGIIKGSYFKVSVVGVSGKNKKITTNKELINQGG